MGIKSDLKRVDAMTDEDIALQIAANPDAAPDMSTVNFPRVRGPQILPTKTSITIRLSNEVIQYFKKDGKGWQSRINDFLLEKLKQDKQD